MNKVINLTEAIIKELRVNNRSNQLEIYDKSFIESGSFGIRLSKNSKSFFYIFKNRKRITIGKYPLFSLKEATYRAIELSKLLGENNSNLVDFKKLSNQHLFSEVVKKFVTEHLNDHYSFKTQKEYMRIITKILLPSLQSIPINKINQTHIDAISNSLKDTKVMKNRVLSVINSIFKYAKNNSYLYNNKIKTKRRSLDKSVNKTEFEPIKISQISQIFKFLQSTNSKASQIIRFLILTSLSIEHITSLKWSQIGIDRIDLGPSNLIDAKRILLINPLLKELILEIRSTPNNTKGKNIKSEFLFKNKIESEVNIRGFVIELQTKHYFQEKWSILSLKKSIETYLYQINKFHYSLGVLLDKKSLLPRKFMQLNDLDSSSLINRSLIEWYRRLEIGTAPKPLHN